MLVANRDWLEVTTLGRAVDTTLPLGKVYVPDGSYREMTEWVLPPALHHDYEQAKTHLAASDLATEVKPFFRAGGFWRNFKARYPESDEMYARMLGISRRLAEASTREGADPDYLEIARRELYRGQCNCPYWHGAFGGLYLPHLRNAIYRCLITAHNALDDAEGKTDPRVALEVGDFNLDARQEVKLENESLVVMARPAQGGQIYELDVRQTAINVLATLQRRPEPITRPSPRPFTQKTAPGRLATVPRVSTTGWCSSKQASTGCSFTTGICARRSLIIFIPLM